MTTALGAMPLLMESSRRIQRQASRRSAPPLARRRPLEKVRVHLPPGDHEHVVRAADNVELSVAQKAEVSGRQPALFERRCGLAEIAGEQASPPNGDRPGVFIAGRGSDLEAAQR